MKKNTLIRTAILFAACFTLPFASLAQDGSLDLTFDSDGKVTTTMASLSNSGQSIVIQSDGKIIVAGSSGSGTSVNFAIARYNTDGSLDNGFDSDGKVLTNVGSSGGYCTSVALQPDGKIVAAGYRSNGSYTEFTVIRYNTDGSLDNTFDTDGKVFTDMGASNDYGNSVIIQSDGKIVLAGESYSNSGTYTDFAIARYNTNGSLDNSFDTDGKVFTDIGGDVDAGYSVTQQSDGKIVVAGVGYDSTVTTTGAGTGSSIVVVRYNTNGSLDNTFDTDGKVATNIAGWFDLGKSVVLQNDGKIVVAGSSTSSLGTGGFVVVRYLPNGSLDNSFSTDGTVVTAVGSSYDDAYSIVLQSDGKIVVAGDSNTDIAVVRYNSDGSLDNSFDTDGKVLTDITVGDSDYGYSLALQSDGKIVVAGSSYNGTNSDFAVVRYNNTSPSGIEESVNGQLVTRIYPNPFFSQTTIQTDPLLKNATLTVYNLHGQEVKQIKNLSGQTITLNRDNLPKGLYFIQLTQDNKILSADKLVIND